MNKGIAFILLTTVAAGSAGTWWYLQNGKTAEPKFQTALASIGDLKQTVTATGQLNPVLNVQVGSQISGNIQKLNADFNSPVKSGDVVAQLDPSIYMAIMHQAEGDLKNAISAHDLAKLTADRKQKLVGEHTAPQAELDTALATLRQTEAQVQIKQANLERTKVDLDHCTIYAPIDGIVISRAVDVGQTVAASMNAPVLFTIANDLKKMQIDANVAEGDVGTVQVGQTVDFGVDAYPYRTFHGTVVQIRNAPINVQNVVAYDTVIAVNNSDLKLKPGMTANVSINIAERTSVIKIPNAALRFKFSESGKKEGRSKKTASTPAPIANPDSGASAAEHQNRNKPSRTVYVLEGDSQKPIPVEIRVGIGDGVNTEVIEGLKENQMVITGYTQPTTSSAPSGSSPFGGGMRRF